MDSLWYKDAVIYELPVQAFYDSNGDGSGDFPGLIEKLDYAPDLGVSAISLLPFHRLLLATAFRSQNTNLSIHATAHSAISRRF
jgi:pullulanase/glycogen debranching enzyme